MAVFVNIRVRIKYNHSLIFLITKLWKSSQKSVMGYDSNILFLLLYNIYLAFQFVLYLESNQKMLRLTEMAIVCAHNICIYVWSFQYVIHLNLGQLRFALHRLGYNIDVLVTKLPSTKNSSFISLFSLSFSVKIYFWCDICELLTPFPG